MTEAPEGSVLSHRRRQRVETMGISRRRSSEARSKGLLLSRERELSQLCCAFDGAVRGHGQVVLVGGEPGIGKTRLAQELASVAAKRAAHVLWGRSCEGEGWPPYWPWAQALRTFAEGATTKDLRAVFGPGTGPISIIVPELREKLRIPERQSAIDPESARFRLFDVVRTFLQRACRQTPILLVFEDLHWADQGSLLLLEFIAQELPAHNVLVLGTYRNDQVPQPLARTFGELARVGVQRLVLSGLTQEDTGRLMAAVSGRRPAAGIIRAVHARTDGNPFFVTEIARLHAPDALAVPENVRASIWRRLSPLSELANQTLVVASVMGGEFDFRVLSAVLCDANEDNLLRALDEGLQALVIEPLPSRGEEWYQFKHALIRDVLYESASPSRRVCWHAAIVRALERLLGARVEDRAGELAQHAARAEVLVGSATLVKYSRIAGEQKLAAHAFEDALPHFKHAWRARNAVPFDSEAAAILSGLGRAQAATAVRWNRQEGWLNLRRAIDYYLQAGEIGRAVAAATHPCIDAEGASDLSDVIERILGDVPRGSTAEGWLRARLGAAVYFETGDHQRARAAFDRALGIAAAHGDPALELRTLAYETSVAHFDVRWQDVLPNSRRVLKLARHIDDLHSETYARYRAAFVLVHIGSVDEARLEVETNLAAAERLREPGLLADALYVATTLAQVTGEWREARAHSDRGLTLSPHHLPLLHGRVLVEYETGNEKDGRGYLQRLLKADLLARPYPLAGVFTAMALSQITRLSNGTTGSEAALAAVRGVLARPSSIPNAVISARIARALLSVRDPRAGDREAELEFLEQFEGVMPIQWCLATGRLLGLLAHAAGHRCRAIARFDAALAFCRRSGYRPELAWTCYDYASALLDSGRRDDRMKAAALLDEGECIAAELGLRPLATRIAAFRERYRVRLDRKPAGLTNRELEILDCSLQARRTRRSHRRCLSASTPSRFMWLASSPRPAPPTGRKPPRTPRSAICSSRPHLTLALPHRLNPKNSQSW